MFLKIQSYFCFTQYSTWFCFDKKRWKKMNGVFFSSKGSVTCVKEKWLFFGRCCKPFYVHKIFELFVKQKGDPKHYCRQTIEKNINYRTILIFFFFFIFQNYSWQLQQLQNKTINNLSNSRALHWANTTLKLKLLIYRKLDSNWFLFIYFFAFTIRIILFTFASI